MNEWVGCTEWALAALIFMAMANQTEWLLISIGYFCGHESKATRKCSHCKTTLKTVKHLALQFWKDDSRYAFCHSIS